jgi:hypothetical protein
MRSLAVCALALLACSDPPEQTPDASACGPALAPTDDGTGLGIELVISEIVPGQQLELFNTTDTDIALAGSSYQLCGRPWYAGLSTLAPDVVVPAGGYALVPWPADFTDTAAGGEIAIYRDLSFTMPASVVDFVCWGTNPHESRADVAIAAGKWTQGGPCPGAMTGGALHRRPMTAGTHAADYDVSSPPSPQSCAP